MRVVDSWLIYHTTKLINKVGCKPCKLMESARNINKKQVLSECFWFRCIVPTTSLKPSIKYARQVFPSLLKKVTWPVWFICTQATDEPFSVPHTSTLRAECCSLSSSKLLATEFHSRCDGNRYLNNHPHLAGQKMQSIPCSHSCRWAISNTGNRNLWPQEPRL